MSESNKMVLLGAGASVEAGIPAAVGLTEKVINHFRLHSRTGQVLRYVYGGLMMGKGARGEDPLQGINVEDLIEAINQLADRKNLQIAPFIALWNEGVTAFQERDARDNLMSAFKELSELARGSEAERAMKHLSIDYTLENYLHGETQDFQYARESVIRELIHMLWIEDSEQVSYFKPLVEQGRDQSFTIATLNYDNTVELACMALGIPCTTGLDDWNALEGFPEPATGIDLLKLHGSVTWQKINKRHHRTPEVPLPRMQVQLQRRDGIKRGYDPAIIFGAGNKLTAEGPFLELLLAFRERLDQHDELIVVGYSFGDEHINDALWRWLNRSQDHKVTVIDFSEDKSQIPFKGIFRYMMDRYTFYLDGAADGLVEVFE